MSQNDHGDQHDLMPALQATQDALAEGISLGDLSARALIASAEAERVIETVDALAATAGGREPFAEFAFALMYWVRAVEGRLHEQSAALAKAEANTLRLGYALEHVRAERDEARREALELRSATTQRSGAIPRDATTAALERAGEAPAEKQQATRVDVEQRPDGTVKQHERTSGKVVDDLCQCGGEVQAKGRLRVCRKCGRSWMEKRAPLAQSPWVPDAEEQLGPQEFHDKGKPSEQTLPERIRELEAEVTTLTDALTVAQTSQAKRKARIDELEAEVMTSDRQVERLQVEAANWRERARSAEAELAATSDRARQNDAKIANLEALLAARNHDVALLCKEQDDERLKAANATQAQAKADEVFAHALRRLLLSTKDGMASVSDIACRAVDLRAALKDCPAARIEFSVKEVLP